MESQSANKNTRRTQSNRELNSGHTELVDRLLEQGSSGDDFFGSEGIFTKLKGALMERLLQAELEAHLEQEGAEAAKNSRNGYSDKTVQTESGPVPIRVPRDRNGTFEPALVKKHQRRVEGFDEKVLALYARDMTTRDIQAHLKDLYGTDVSHELISKATDAVLPEFRDWQSRALEAVYPVVYLDALFVSVRDGVQVQKRAFYVALGIRLDGRRDVLGIWAAETEGAKFWLSILNELRSRGVEDILFVCADGLSGLDKALETAFPKAVFQTCVVHLIRSALRFVSWADRARPRRAFRVTTDSRFTEHIAPNLLDRNFVAARPNEVWVTDVTALPVLGGWVFLASIIDLYARRVVSWELSENNDTALALAALREAVRKRRPPPGVLHHSDRGSPYGSGSYIAELAQHGFVRSMSRKGNCWDNAVAESFFSTLEHECIQGRVFADLEHARSVIADYVDGFYNPVRLHSTNGFKSPIVSELCLHSHPQAA